MKPGPGTVVLLLGVTLWSATLAAEEAGAGAKPPRTRVQNQLQLLLRADAGRDNPLATKTAGVSESIVLAEESLQLEPMVIREKPIEIPPPETKAAYFLRTGTVWEKVGRTFTRRFWVDGGRGVGFTLSW
ncbi:MAG TPA: hypothetical protein VG734_07910 [Lacunisphaera sp.]|nr:hypothetical protein [Lacunisphaera sp.]